MLQKSYETGETYKKIRNIIDIIIGSGKTLQILVKSMNQINFTPKHEYFKYK